jgi:hypothetical protein
MRLKMKLAALAALATMLAAGSAGAMTTFNLTWSGAFFGNSAVAHGFITLDTALLPKIPFGSAVILPDPGVTALSLDVSGASAGNGHFDLSDYLQHEAAVGIAFWAPATLDLGEELIGQDLGNGCTFGEFTDLCVFPRGQALDRSGEFNIIALGGTLPTGLSPFVLTTSGHDQMLLTSMVAASAPEPAVWALMIGGFGLVGAALRRRRVVAA